MAVHPFVSFRGVTAHLDVQFTFTHGIAPSQCQIQVPPTPGIEEGGTLALCFGGRRIDFPDCKVDRVDASRNADGLMVWTLTVLDRRWKWKECGQVSGYYNVREGESESAAAGIPKQIRKGTEKNIKALMKLCLEAMGERGYDLSRVTTDFYPEVEWDYANPAEALAKLADEIKFRVVLSLRNRVELWPEGQGQKLTQSGTIEYQLTVDPPERPDQLIYVGARALWEMDLELEPIARSGAGHWQPLNSTALEYLPSTTPINGNYWHAFDAEFGNNIFDQPLKTIDGIKTFRDLAKADVYKKYRVKVPVRVSPIGRIEELERLLPLLGSRLKTRTVNGVDKARPPLVWGIFSREEAGPDYFQEVRNPTSKLDSDGEPPKEMQLEGGWQLDEKTGIVAFDKPRYRFVKHDEPLLVDDLPIYRPYMFPAQLFLRVGFGVRDRATRGWYHREVVRKSRNKRFGTQPRYITSPDDHLRGIAGKKGVEFNDKEYEKIAKFYLDAEERKYETRDPCAATYPGLLSVNPDGAIQQITWSITERGATTRLSRNREDPVLGLTYAEQRLFQQVSDRLKTAATAKAAEENRRKRPA